jgi:hypothetical protein
MGFAINERVSPQLLRLKEHRSRYLERSSGLAEHTWTRPGYRITVNTQNLITKAITVYLFDHRHRVRVCHDFVLGVSRYSDLWRQVDVEVINTEPIPDENETAMYVEVGRRYSNPRRKIKLVKWVDCTGQERDACLNKASGDLVVATSISID